MPKKQFRWADALFLMVLGICLLVLAAGVLTTN